MFMFTTALDMKTKYGLWDVWEHFKRGKTYIIHQDEIEGEIPLYIWARKKDILEGLNEELNETKKDRRHLIKRWKKMRRLKNAMELVTLSFDIVVDSICKHVVYNTETEN